MKVVSDAGPLIAFAKIGGLETLFRLYPRILTPPAVYAETIYQGRFAQARDAALLQAEYEVGRLRVENVDQTALPQPAKHLGRGETESIQLALSTSATWLLADDLDARTSANRIFRSANVETRVKGTLGVIVSAYVEGLSTLRESLELLEAIRARRDIWVSTELCEQVVATLRRQKR